MISVSHEPPVIQVAQQVAALSEWVPGRQVALRGARSSKGGTLTLAAAQSGSGHGRGAPAAGQWGKPQLRALLRSKLCSAQTGSPLAAAETFRFWVTRDWDENEFEFQAAFLFVPSLRTIVRGPEPQLGERRSPRKEITQHPETPCVQQHFVVLEGLRR